MESTLISDQVGHFPQSHYNGHALTSDHVRLHITFISERPSVLDQVFLVIDQELPFQEWQQTLYLIKWEHIPQSHQNGHALTYDHVRIHLTII